MKKINKFVLILLLFFGISPLNYAQSVRLKECICKPLDASAIILDRYTVYTYYLGNPSADCDECSSASAGYGAIEHQAYIPWMYSYITIYSEILPNSNVCSQAQGYWISFCTGIEWTW